MWPASMITAGAAAFGRLLVAGILPSVLITAVMWALLHARAFDAQVHGLTIERLVPADVSIDKSGNILLFLLAVVVLTAILQGFQVGVVRVLEGYWGASPVAVVFFAIGVRRHRARLGRAIAELTEADRLLREVRTEQPGAVMRRRLPEQATHLRAMVRTGLRLERARLAVESHPPDDTDLLPTRLGNALRSGERRAGERYGWSTVHAWPRLYHRLPEALALSYRSTVDVVDSAAIFCLTFSVLAATMALAFYNDPAMLWAPLLAGVLAFVSYRAAVVTAVTQGVLQQVAFDLHRFDLLDGLHYKLPDSIEDEQLLARQISRFMADGTLPAKAPIYLAGLRYSHPKTDADDAAPDGEEAGATSRHQRSTTTVPATPPERSRKTAPVASTPSRRPRSSKATKADGGPSRTTGQ